MSKAIGTILVLYVISKMFSQAFLAFEAATTATFNTIETAAVISEAELRSAR